MKTRRLRTTAFLLVVLATALPVRAQLGGKAGAFSRMGFGARGIGMGNALTAVVTGDLVGYYNPAALSFAGSRNAGIGFGILPLDRRLNFLSYSQPVPATAGIAFGIINAGVGDIDGRDRDGEPTGALQTSENEVFLGFANRFSPHLSLGVNVKLYYHHLYTDVSVLSVGLDFGAIVPLTDEVTLGATVRDINSQYRWDTSTLYGSTSGNTTRDKFPLLYTAGASWRIPDSIGLISADLEMSNQKTLTLRAGVEVPLIPELAVRAGIDRVDLKTEGAGVRPSFGFTLRKSFETWVPSLQYVYVHEPFVASGMHVISLAVTL